MSRRIVFGHYRRHALSNWAPQLRWIDLRSPRRKAVSLDQCQLASRHSLGCSTVDAVGMASVTSPLALSFNPVGSRVFAIGNTASEAERLHRGGSCTGSIGKFRARCFFPNKNLDGFGDKDLIATYEHRFDDLSRMPLAHGAGMEHHHDLDGEMRQDALPFPLLSVRPSHVFRWNCRRLVLWRGSRGG